MPGPLRVALLLGLFPIGCATDPVGGPQRGRAERVEATARYDDETPLRFEDMSPEITFGPYRRGDPMVGRFDPEAAARFLDRVATSWGKKYQCVTCHTNGYYLTAPPQIFGERPAFAEARRQAEAFVDSWDAITPHSILAVLGYVVVPETYVVATAAFLAMNDAAAGREPGEATLRALGRAWRAQDATGAWSDWIVCNWPPFESDLHYGPTLMAIAVGMLPDGYRRTEAARTGMARIRDFLRKNPPMLIHHKGMMLWAAKYHDGLVSEANRRRWIEELFELQRPDGAWASGDLGAWRQRDGRPEDPPATIESDGYGTGFALFVLMQAGVPASDPRIQRGIAWLKTHQRAGGHWWTQSLRNDPETSNFLTHTGTTFALKALVASGAIATGPSARGAAPDGGATSGTRSN